MLIAFWKLAAVIVGTVVAIPVSLVAADSYLRSHIVMGERERWVAPDGSATVVIYGALTGLAGRSMSTRSTISGR